MNKMSALRNSEFIPLDLEVGNKIPTISLVIPAHNEEDTIAAVINAYANLADDMGTTLFKQILVCDNASTDNTFAIAEQCGATVITEDKRGYGQACYSGVKALSEVDIVLFVDADGSADPADCVPLIEKILQGADLAIGSRSRGICETGALPFHQTMGNSFACWLINRLWRQNVTDLGPFRAVKWDAFQQLQMIDRSYGWTVEMQIKAILMNLKTTEIPVRTFPRQGGRSKISGTIMGSVFAGLKIISTILKMKLLSSLTSNYARAH